MTTDDSLTRALQEYVAGQARERRERLYGIYRGKVVAVGTKSAGKEERLGQLQVQVPDVWGARVSDLPWAAPAAPFAGDKYGLLMLPRVDDGVWMMFEAGDPDRPVWLGGWWSEDAKLPDSSAENVRAVVTPAGHKVVLDDDKGELRVEHAKGTRIVVGESEIRLEVKGGGKIVIDKQGVKINDDALKVDK